MSIYANISYLVIRKRLLAGTPKNDSLAVAKRKLFSTIHCWNDEHLIELCFCLWKRNFIFQFAAQSKAASRGENYFVWKLHVDIVVVVDVDANTTSNTWLSAVIGSQDSNAIPICLLTEDISSCSCLLPKLHASLWYLVWRRRTHSGIRQKLYALMVLKLLLFSPTLNWKSNMKGSQFFWSLVWYRMSRRVRFQFLPSIWCYWASACIAVLSLAWSPNSAIAHFSMRVLKSIKRSGVSIISSRVFSRHTLNIWRVIYWQGLKLRW